MNILWEENIVNKTIKTMAVAIVATVYFGLPDAVAQTKKHPKDEAVIRRFLLERVEAFNRHEGPQAAVYTPDADFVNVYGMWRKGPAEIEGRQKERMGTVLRNAKITLIDLRIRFIRPDVAIVHQKHEMSGMLDAEGKTMPPHQELGVRVMVKEHGKWLTTAFHNTIVRP
jgi:uncharacterized protein (TIGR02246 family)